MPVEFSEDHRGVQTDAVVLESAHYRINEPFPGFDLDYVYRRYLHPDNVEAWRRRAIALLDEQFVTEGDAALVLSFLRTPSLRNVQAYWCKLKYIDGKKFLRATDRLETRPAN